MCSTTCGTLQHQNPQEVKDGPDDWKRDNDVKDTGPDSWNVPQNEMTGSIPGKDEQLGAGRGDMPPAVHTNMKIPMW